MTLHSSATALDETPHDLETTKTTISDALRLRAQAVINDMSIDLQWRNIVRYALEIGYPLLSDLVRRAGAGERIIAIQPTARKHPKSTRIILTEKSLKH